MFNIYYINYNKAFEIAMLNNNEIIDFEEIEALQEQKKKTDKHLEGNVEGSTKVPWFTKFGLAVKGGISVGNENNSLERLKRNVQVVQSNSILLEAILDLVHNADFTDTLKEGTLVKIDDLSLAIKNEEDVRTAKMLTSGTLSEIDSLKFEGMAINVDTLMTSMMSDYFYIVSGKTMNKKNILLKIPLSESFQSSYSIDDLLIGKVSVVGMYKGIITENDLSNTFNFFKSAGEKTKKSKESQIVESTYKGSDKHTPSSDLPNEIDEYHFIDTIAVLQNVVLIGEDDTNG